MFATIKAIEYYLPEQVLTNEQLACEFPEWSSEKIIEKLGIAERHIAAKDECASDLGYFAAKKLFATKVCSPDQIDFLLFCTQSPDYFLPTTACLLQERLGIPNLSGALDFNLGCSGFVYGLALAKGLIESQQCKNVLLITAETYSKFMDEKGKDVRTLFGDGAAATFIQSSIEPGIGPVVFGTDGSGANNLIVSGGGMRNRIKREMGYTIHMNGPEIFTFSLKVVPDIVGRVLLKAKSSLEDIDLFIFHQANKFMLEQLRQKMNIPKNKFYISMQHVGNTVSSTIPIAIKDAYAKGMLQHGNRVMLVGFGVGYSWGATIVNIV